jgi:SAM-dependent methyltransferase
MSRSPTEVTMVVPGDTDKFPHTIGVLARRYPTLGRWLDGGEEAAFGVIATRVRGRAVLDVGIGPGRTTSLLRLLTDDYVGLDYMPTMVERARRSHPDRNLSEGDARDLSRFEDGRFDLVLFSYNGIDWVSHDDRPVVLREFHRVLRNDGVLVFSTLNKDGPYYREPPWRAATAGLAGRTPLQRAGRVLGLVVHWTTVPAACAEIDAAGFAVTDVFGVDGDPLDPGRTNTETPYFHLVATKR